MAASVRDRKTANLRDYGVLDPRVLGMDVCPTTALQSSHLESLIGCANRSNVGCERVTEAGVELWRIAFDLAGENGRVQIVVAPEKDYEVVRIEREFERVSARFRYRLVCEHAPVGQARYWFPTRLDYTQTMNDELTLEEHTTISPITLNAPLAAERFTLV